ncbi:MAG: tRNA (adenosine(37)-N6)-threonylcarbamoyltransferase complex transferase subunit TsaD [Chloroflexi bacterium]|nr:tRNA (adenosine(37)-N6)-threonylcarbamoyltransferase complex transferase subunit TsaD [Chloroflexota bacterium]MDA1226348.1 tRNA (adenosine(37)-N6)-threonylcarbamoyltransferase complex transferase subunit TsaD [Chloroflexota bacterium]
MKIIGIESSCDESAAAVIEDGRVIHSNVIASQAEMHAQYGGIVPEVASRQHMITIIPVMQEALEQAGMKASELDGIAVTYGPGLAGSLLIGVNAAKGLALANELPFIGINHLEGHIYASWLEDMDPEQGTGFPLICLIASGGHTDLILMEGHGRYTLVGRTRDDAAGEAFDKAARVLGLGFPGGPAIQKASESSVAGEARFPRPTVKDSLDFSFSGLKSAVVRRAQEKHMYPPPEDSELDPQQVANVAAAFQEAMVDSMVTQTIAAAKLHKVKGILLGGGVASNSLLRVEMRKRAPVEVIVPAPALCTDNGAMIGAAAFFHLRHGNRFQWDMDVIPNLRLG